MIGIIIVIIVALGFYFSRTKTVANKTPDANEI